MCGGPSCSCNCALSPADPLLPNMLRSVCIGLTCFYTYLLNLNLNPPLTHLHAPTNARTRR